MNKTKVIATIGPSSSSKEVIQELIIQGMDVARINLSHANYDFCTDVMNKIADINEELESNVAVMLDLQGPGVRVGRFVSGRAYLKAGDRIRVYATNVLGDNTKFSVNYPGIIDDVKYHTVIKLDDGAITLTVIDKEVDYLLCEVMNDGVISDYKSFNAPGVVFRLPFLSEQDRRAVQFAHKMKADFLALSFVRSSDDVLEVNDLLIELGNDHLGIIAKIETESAVEEIDDILKVSDGIMIARGDLGVELPMERVPVIQKSIINKCHIAGKVSMVATEFLSSMESGIRPTRAEVSDVANAVMDGTDAVMLSGETTIGAYPIETLMMMEKIIGSSEGDINYLELLDTAMRTEKQDTTGVLAYSVAECANRLKCKAIVALTMSGYTARKMSRFRPGCPIIALSPNMETVKSLALHFGVVPVLVRDLSSFDVIMKEAVRVTRELVMVDSGDKIIITGGYPFQEVKHTNFMKVEEL